MPQMNGATTQCPPQSVACRLFRRTRLTSATWLSLALLLPVGTAAAAAGSNPSPFETKVTNGIGGGEPEVAADPVHHALVIAFMHDNPYPQGTSGDACGIAVSHDDGATWKVSLTSPTDPGPLPVDPIHNCDDPTAAAGARGTLYIGSGVWNTPTGETNDYNVYASRSTDGGLTWGPPVYTTGNKDLATNLLLGSPKNTGLIDRDWLTADRTTGTVYMSSGDTPRFESWVVASHDEGRTFGAPHVIDSPTYPQMPARMYIASAADGVLAVSYLTPGLEPDCNCQPIFETSRDDGVSWTRHPAPIPAQWTAADPSHPGRFAIMSGGAVTFDWSTTPDMLMVSVTSDYGKTWSKPVQIGQNPPNPRWKPGISYSPNGILGVAYRTDYGANCVIAVACTGGNGYDQWAAISRDGGYSFGPPIRISQGLSPAESGGPDDFGNNVTLDDNYLYVAWADMRTTPNSSATDGKQSLYFGRIPLTPGPTVAAGSSALKRRPSGTRNGPIAPAMSQAELARTQQLDYQRTADYINTFCSNPLGTRFGFPPTTAAQVEGTPTGYPTPGGQCSY
jgi:hypothetical protein